MAILLRRISTRLKTKKKKKKTEDTLPIEEVGNNYNGLIRNYVNNKKIE